MRDGATMPKLNLRTQRRTLDLKARGIRRRRLTKDAKSVIDLVQASGIHERQGVVLLVFDAAEGDMHGYINVDPILAAMALVSYLEQRHPGTKGPKDVGTRAIVSTRAEEAGATI